MRIIIIIVIGTLTCAINGCTLNNSSSLPVSVPGERAVDTDSRAVVILDDWSDLSFPQDSAVIVDAWILADSIKIIVAYNRGYKKHIFRLFADNNFIETGIPIVQVCLSHNSVGDTRRSNVSDTLAFSLIPLQQRFIQCYNVRYKIYLEIFVQPYNNPFMPWPLYDFSDDSKLTILPSEYAR